MGRDGENAQVAYRTLRRIVGLLGVLLPVLLAIGNPLLGARLELQSSISEYYGTAMRDVLVGFLFAIGLFLFSYHGYGPPQSRCGRVSNWPALPRKGHLCRPP